MMNKAVKKYIGKRLYAYIYILHKLFDGDKNEFCRAMRIPDIYPVDVQKWDDEYGPMVENDIEAEARLASETRDGDGNTPTIAALQDAMLLRIQALITRTDDPSKLATCYKILAEYGKDSSKSKGSMGAIDAIMKNMKPKSSKRLMQTEEEREKARLHPDTEE